VGPVALDLHALLRHAVLGDGVALDPPHGGADLLAALEPEVRADQLGVVGEDPVHQGVVAIVGNPGVEVHQRPQRQPVGDLALPHVPMLARPAPGRHPARRLWYCTPAWEPLRVPTPSRRPEEPAVSRDALRKSDALHHLHPFVDPEQLVRQGVRMLVRGDGVHVEDAEGRRYLDGMAGLWCVQVGYGRRELIDAARRQLETLPYYNTFFHSTTEPLAALVEALRARTPGDLDSFFFANSGSEAIDSAVRLVRQYWSLRGQPERRAIIGREFGYHGSTLASASVGGMAKMHAQGGLPLPDFHHVMPPYAFEYGRGEDPDAFGRRAAEALERKILELGPERVAAFFGEPLMGAGGVILPPASYWPAVQEICRRHDVLLLADEVICGFGRTGSDWGSRTFGIEPDLISMAKGLTSGYVPMSALALSDRIASVLRGGGVLQHGFTYSGHPVAAAVALANLEVIESEGLAARAGGAPGERFQRGIRSLASSPLVGETRGVGLIAGIELVRDRESGERFEPPGHAASRALALCLEEGLIVRSIREGLAVCPPLTISEDEIDELVAKLGRALARLADELA
jgi:putrescine aminotransferase